MSATRPPHPDAQTIEQVAQVAAAALDGHSEGADHIDHFRIIARALAEEGLLAAAPEPRADLADIEKAIRDGLAEEGLHHVSPWVRAAGKAVFALVSGSDPAVHVVRESDVEAQAALRNRFGEFVVNGTVLNVTTAEDCREKAQRHLDAAARCEGIARAIEAEQAVDPVEELAEQIETATRAAIRQACDDLAGVVPALDPLAVEQAMEVTAASRKVAAHVLGQGDRHVDQ